MEPILREVPGWVVNKCCVSVSFQIFVREQGASPLHPRRSLLSGPQETGTTGYAVSPFAPLRSDDYAPPSLFPAVLFWYAN